MKTYTTGNQIELEKEILICEECGDPKEILIDGELVCKQCEAIPCKKCGQSRWYVVNEDRWECPGCELGYNDDSEEHNEDYYTTEPEDLRMKCFDCDTWFGGCPTCGPG